MGPEDILLTDRSIFDSELDDLIGSAMNSGASSPSRKRPAIQRDQNKRRKISRDYGEGNPSEDEHTHMHPARKAFLEQATSDEFENIPSSSKEQELVVTGGNLVPLPSPASVVRIPSGPR